MNKQHEIDMPNVNFGVVFGLFGYDLVGIGNTKCSLSNAWGFETNARPERKWVRVLVEYRLNVLLG